ncbi:hypothetical protein ACHAXA_003053 [Cyclostephanos tholiformis]|uniref:Uncharacterized protein n=1 Tax=Cyclostephanos tholiformis TaxID=382380 RepID=A0ABD3RYM2_9STRA
MLGPASVDQLTSRGSASTPPLGDTMESFLPSPKSSALGNLQIRRVIRRKCSLAALRRILERPPKLVEINESIIDSPGSDDVDDSHAPSISKLLQRRREMRQMGFSRLSKEQQSFMNEQKKKYEKRLRHEEKDRQHVARAILAGCDEGVDLPAIRSLSLNDMESSSQASGDTPDEDEDGINHQSSSESRNPHQKIIQEKIEIADMGLAILMGEAQRLKSMLLSMKEEKEEEKDYDTGSERMISIRMQSNSDTDSSCSTDFRSRSLSTNSRHINQGCEVEYSFPHEYHDELEMALMGRNDDYCDDSSLPDEYSDEESGESSGSIMSERHRGRSLGRDTKYSAAKETLSPIVAIPTNDKGCVVIRKNGSFDVVGEIPEKLFKKLFREKALPVQISLGTLRRYFVLFNDGSFNFCGPPSLSKILIKAGKTKNDGKNQVSIASVAFGKELDDYFVVRSDGTWQSHGVMPSGLDKLMRDRRNRADLLWVSLGVCGEWCVKAKNGRVWWGNVSDEADETLADITAEDSEREVKYIDFGTSDTYFILYE